MFPRTFAVAITGAAVFAVATVASSLAIQWVTDHVIVPRFDEGHVATGTVVAGVAFIVAVGVVRAIGVVTRRSYAARGQWQVRGGLQEQVLAQYQAQPLAWHSIHGSGDLVAHAGVDTEAATEVLAPLPYSTGVGPADRRLRRLAARHRSRARRRRRAAVPAADRHQRLLPAPRRRPRRRSPRTASAR